MNAVPTIDFTSPSKEGGNDFATTVMGNAWDFNSTSDLDLSYRVTSMSASTANIEDLNGDFTNGVTVLKGTNQSGSRDPVLYPLLWWGSGRGQTYPIDTSLYRILVLKMGLPGSWDLNEGSIARVVWKRVGDGDNENVSEDIIIRHKSGGRLVMNTIIADMKDIPLESNSPNKSGWTGTVEGFRLDPHEFSSSKTFYVESIKLAAYERADTSFTIRWDAADPDADQYVAGTDQTAATATLSLYRDTNGTGFNGTLIKSGLSPSAGSYTWNTANMSAGTYYIYGVVSDGINSNQAYARWPIVVDHTAASVPEISLSKSSMSFTASGSQGFSVSNSGSGTLSWTASDNASWMSVSPTSGTNSGTVTVTVNTSGLSAGSYSGKVTVSDTNASNSPRTVSVTLTISGGGGGGGGGTTAKLSLDHDELVFGAVGSTMTSPQSILVSNSGSGTMNWTVSDNKPWMSVNPTSGSGAGEFTVYVNSSGLAAGKYVGNVTVSSANATNSPLTVKITFVVKTKGAVPFGQFSTPVAGTTLRSSIPVTGWVLDDTEVTNVKIYNGSKYVGDAVFVDGARPDVAGSYEDTPLKTRAGWGYMMLTNFLPNGGNGSYTFHAYATDKEGNTISLGSKRVTLDNNGASKPFGAIDTPTQGGTASGSSFINWGWALTPLPNTIATSGATIDVWIDGVKLGHPAYNIYRADIAGLFPSYNNSKGAIGYYYIDTTAYSNGLHSIQWTAKDNAGNNDGIGSRYFNIKNTGADAAQTTGTDAAQATGTDMIQTMGTDMTEADGRIAVQRGGGLIADGSRLKAKSYPVNTAAIAEAQLPQDSQFALWVRKGYDESTPMEMIQADENGAVNIEVFEGQRLEVHFFNQSEGKDLQLTGSGGLDINPSNARIDPRVLNRTRLPIGSTLDITQGVFYWQLGAGYLGTFPLEFATIQGSEWWTKKISVTVTPKRQ